MVGAVVVKRVLERTLLGLYSTGESVGVKQRVEAQFGLVTLRPRFLI